MRLLFRSYNFYPRGGADDLVKILNPVDNPIDVLNALDDNFMVSTAHVAEITGSPFLMNSDPRQYTLTIIERFEYTNDEHPSVWKRASTNLP